MVTEVDEAVAMNGDNLKDSNDLQRQGSVYWAMVKYVLYFSPKCHVLITWVFTNRYSWIPSFPNYREGAALPMDWNYQPKSAYWRIQEELARFLPDGTYRITPKSNSNVALDTYDMGETGAVQVYNSWNGANQKWNLTWLGDGTSRLSPQSAKSQALDIYNEKLSQADAQSYNCWNGDNQK